MAATPSIGPYLAAAAAAAAAASSSCSKVNSPTSSDLSPYPGSGIVSSGIATDSAGNSGCSSSAILTTDEMHLQQQQQTCANGSDYSLLPMGASSSQISADQVNDMKYSSPAQNRSHYRPTLNNHYLSAPHPHPQPPTPSHPQQHYYLNGYSFLGNHDVVQRPYPHWIQTGLQGAWSSTAAGMMHGGSIASGQDDVIDSKPSHLDILQETTRQQLQCRDPHLQVVSPNWSPAATGGHQPHQMTMPDHHHHPHHPHQSTVAEYLLNGGYHHHGSGTGPYSWSLRETLDSIDSSHHST